VAINSFPIPSSRKHVRQFLGKINFYRKFIPNSASLLEPFHQLLRKNTPFSWNPACQTAFEKVKKLLTSAPILAIFDRSKPIFIHTDASGVGIGAVLKQTQADGSQRPVAYFSRKLSEAQKKKKAIYIEGLAVREAVRYWRFWLIGRHFTVITDHKPLQHLNLKARTDEELGDLANELLQFDFDILYSPGSSNDEADCLSRNPVLMPISDSLPSEPLLPSFHFFFLGEIKDLQSNVIPLPSDALKNDIVFRKVHRKSRIVLDIDAGKNLTNIIHARFGHLGSKHVIAIVTKFFTFPNMYNIITNICKNCSICLQCKSRRSRRSARLGLLGPASAPYEIMSLDTVGGFKNNNSSLNYLHILVDHFSRHAFILCSKGQTVKEMISLVDLVHKNYPIGTLMTDQYGGLSSDEFRSYCSTSGITHVFCAVDCAFSNGLNERLNQTLVNRIRCTKHDKSVSPKKSWAAVASKCVQQYNDSPHSVTKFPPSYLLTGKPVSIIPNVLTHPPDVSSDRAIALKNSIRYHNYNKKRYDACKNPIDFSVGDFVYVDNGNKLNRNKLDKLRIGPFPIVDRVSNNVFLVETGNGPFSKRLYHSSKLLRCTNDDRPP
jgi:transposase InsO family protein